MSAATATISRDAARMLGLKQYFTGVPCRHGHISPRSTINTTCLECSRLRTYRSFCAARGSEDHVQKVSKILASRRAANAERIRKEKEVISAARGGREIIWRKEARLRGLQKYFTGKPCSRGHVAVRLVSDGACTDCASLKSERQWSQNKNHIRARVKLWARKNRDGLFVKAVAWREANREMVASFRRNRRARERSADGRHTGADIKAIFVLQGGHCACGCGTSLSDIYEVDHKIPISRGGSNWPDNLQLMSPSCNRSKSDKTMEEWMACKTGIRAATLMRMA